MLPKLTKEQRNKTVEILRTAQLYMQIGLNPKKEARMVSRVYFGEGAAQTDSTEAVRMFLRQTDAALESLEETEREVIERTFLASGEQRDYMVWTSLHISERKFYRIKERALTKLALMFGVLPIDAVPVPKLGQEAGANV